MHRRNVKGSLFVHRRRMCVWTDKTTITSMSLRVRYCRPKLWMRNRIVQNEGGSVKQRKRMKGKPRRRKSRKTRGWMLTGRVRRQRCRIDLSGGSGEVGSRYRQRGLCRLRGVAYYERHSLHRWDHCKGRSAGRWMMGPRPRWTWREDSALGWEERISEGTRGLKHQHCILLRFVCCNCIGMYLPPCDVVK